MMAASMAPPFVIHQPGMSAHAGAPHGGHSMVQTHPPGQGVPGGGQQPGVSIGQQIHAGMAGLGVPQASPGPVISGMMPGGGPTGVSGSGPSSYALAHLHSPQGQLIQNQMHQSKSLLALSSIIAFGVGVSDLQKLQLVNSPVLFARWIMEKYLFLIKLICD